MAGAILERILAIVSEGPKLGTHKLALLLAILDACVEGSDERGIPPSRVHSADLARRVIALHWRHALPFVRADGSEVELAQVSPVKGRHLYVQVVAELRKVAGADAATRIDDAIATAGAAYARAVERVEPALIRDPIVRLQNLGRQSANFLYQPPSATARSCTLELLPGAADELVRFSSALRPLIEFEFARKVATLNRLDQEQDRLLKYLFGAPRSALPSDARRELLDLQGGRCFYSGARLRSSDAHVDHFIPWSRHALSTIENLVLCHRRENNAKSNHLAASKFVQAWAERVRDERNRLRAIASRHGFEFAPKRTIAVAATLYRHLAPDAPLWSGANTFELARPEQILLTLTTALGSR